MPHATVRQPCIRAAAPGRTCYRILVFPGGGIRGVLTATLLERLEALRPGLVAGADLLAGTSTGGLLALGLAAGRSPGDLRAVYERHGAEIFRSSWWRRTWTMGRLLGPGFANGPLQDVVVRLLGDLTLGALERRVLVSSFDLDNEDPNSRRRRWKAKFFHNYPGTDSGDRLCPAAYAAMATSAAPTYFPAWDGYIDGGVVANDPSLAAIAQALDRRHPEHQELRDIALLSIGTGEVPRFVGGDDLAWGLGRWARPLVEIMFDGGMGAVGFIAEQLLGDRYHRLQVTLAHQVGLAKHEATSDLVGIGRGADLAPTLEWLDRNWA